VNLSRGARLGYLLGCAALFAAGCYAVFVTNIRRVDWYFGMCPGDPGCARVEFLIQYWWALFGPAVLLASALAYALYRRLFRHA
jgi:hypothetical protein